MTFQHNKTQSPKMFDRIARRYDLLNRILSGGIDVSWRKKMANFLPGAPNLQLLDIATGTADQIIYLLKSNRIEKAIGIDLSDGMLTEGRKKISQMRLDSKVELRKGDACEIPFSPNIFDVVTISFGIRNIPDVQKSLNEMFRVLKPGGRVLILEFSLPAISWIRKPYLFYFRNILPTIGETISGDGIAYRYLNATVENFPHGQAFLELMKNAGFHELHQEMLTFGIASIYIGVKPMEPTEKAWN